MRRYQDCIHEAGHVVGNIIGGIYVLEAIVFTEAQIRSGRNRYISQRGNVTEGICGIVVSVDSSMNHCFMSATLDANRRFGDDKDDWDSDGWEGYYDSLWKNTLHIGTMIAGLKEPNPSSATIDTTLNAMFLGSAIEAIAQAAGPVAEYLYEKSDMIFCDYIREVSASDADIIYEHAACWHDTHEGHYEFFEKVEAEAMAMLSIPVVWSAVEAVANELKKRGKLDGEKAKQIIIGAGCESLITVAGCKDAWRFSSGLSVVE